MEDLLVALKIQERFSLGLWLQVHKPLILLCFLDVQMMEHFFPLGCPQTGWPLAMLCKDLPQVPWLSHRQSLHMAHSPVGESREPCVRE